MALFDTQLAMLANQASNALVCGEDPPRQGTGHPNIVPYQPFEAADQPIIIAVGNDRQFARLAAMFGHPEWATDPAFATNAARVAARDELVPLIAEIIAHPAGGGMARASWSRRAFRPGRSTRSARRWPIRRRSIAARGISAGGGALGEVPMVGWPIRIDGERSDAPLPPPALGEHGDIASRDGLAMRRLSGCKAAGVIG